MIIKALGLIDILAGIGFWLFGVFGILEGVILILGLVLLCKGIVFSVSGDAISVLDIVFGLVMVVGVSIHLPIFVVIIASLFLLQKGIFSMLG